MFELTIDIVHSLSKYWTHIYTLPIGYKNTEHLNNVHFAWVLI